MTHQGPTAGAADSAPDRGPAAADAPAGPPNPFATWVGRVLALVLVVGGVVAVVAVARLGALPGAWVAAIAAVGLAAAAAVALGLWLTKAPPAWIRFAVLVLVAVVGIAGEALAVKAVTDVDRFFVDTAPKLPTTEYNVIALTDHPTGEDSLIQDSVGVLVDDPNKDAVEEHLVGRFKNTFANCADPTDLATQLTAGRFDSAVLDANRYAAYQEGDSGFFEATQVLYTFDLATAMAPPPPTAPPSGRPGDSFVVYISGIDTAGPVSRVSRSDVNILMAVNPAAGKVLLVNTPRDYYVQLHGTDGTKDKLTHSGIYGVRMSIDTLQDLYGIPIDYYARVNFTSLVKMVDLVGGIDVDNPQTFQSAQGGGMTFEAGALHLDGDRALAFSRERHAFTAGDRERGRNQQLVIGGLIAKASQRSNLLRYSELLDALADAVEMDVPQSEVARLVKLRLEDSKAWEVESVSVDGTGAMEPTYSMGSMRLYVMIPDQATNAAAKAAIEATLAE
jgi:LCP family protein required for cell wall assembly